MVDKDKHNNLITHKIGLYYTAYLLSREEKKVEIDTAHSNQGHLKVMTSKKEYMVLSKTLSKLDPVPLDENDVDQLSNFDYMIVCTGAYEDIIHAYQVPISIVKEKIHSNIGANGKTNYWLEPKEYLNFEVKSFNFQ